MPNPCPTPDKVRYATRAGAEQGAHRARLHFDDTVYPYACSCTWWHLSKNQPESTPSPEDASRAAIERVAALPSIAFREIVANDAAGKGDRDERGALRAPVNLTRWRRALGELLHDVQEQLTSSRWNKTLAAQDWRKRATGYQEQLLRRQVECKQLRADAHAVGVSSRVASRRRVVDAARLSGAPVKELRRLAGEMAVDRLIEAHRGEFDGLLAEEYAAVDLPLPEGVMQRMTEAEVGAAS
ncbi:hypothetical protein [Streptomyces sp. NPDC006784]|uniref:hypothetical protein n=1 Tax=Streptomyces sp. NPDC006784 TaxID=3364764 RepID=UPI0036812496